MKQSHDSKNKTEQCHIYTDSNIPLNRTQMEIPNTKRTTIQGNPSCAMAHDGFGFQQQNYHNQQDNLL